MPTITELDALVQNGDIYDLLAAVDLAAMTCFGVHPSTMWVDFSQFPSSHLPNIPSVAHLSSVARNSPAIDVVDLNHPLYGRAGFDKNALYFAAGVQSNFYICVPLVNGKADLSHICYGAAADFLAHAREKSSRPKKEAISAICSHSEYVESGFGAAYCKSCPAKASIVGGVLKWS